MGAIRMNVDINIDEEVLIKLVMGLGDSQKKDIEKALNSMMGMYLDNIVKSLNNFCETEYPKNIQKLSRKEAINVILREFSDIISLAQATNMPQKICKKEE